MRATRLTLGWAAWVAMTLAISPLAYSQAVNMAYTHEALSREAYLQLLFGVQVLETPVRVYSLLTGRSPFIWLEHSRNATFVADLVEYLLVNAVGWFAGLLVVKSVGGWVWERCRAARAAGPAPGG